MEIVATVSWQCVVNYTEKTLYVHFFFLSRYKRNERIRNTEEKKYKSEHDLQILYTSHFLQNSELHFCRKYFGLQTFVSYLNVLSVCIQQDAEYTSHYRLKHTIKQMSSVSIYVLKLSNILSIWGPGQRNFIKRRKAVLFCLLFTFIFGFGGCSPFVFVFFLNQKFFLGIKCLSALHTGFALVFIRIQQSEDS